MLDEYKEVIENGTGTLIDCLPNVKPIGCKWVYRIKYKLYAMIDKYQARLVAKGLHKRKGLIVKKIVRQQQSGTQSKWYLYYLLKRDGKYIKWMSKAPSSMEICKKKYIWLNLLVLSSKDRNKKFVSWSRRYMDWNKLPKLGMPKWMSIFAKLDLRKVKLMIPYMCTYKGKSSNFSNVCWWFDH